MLSYQITKAAEKDLEAILDFGIEHFGIDAAIQYYEQLVLKFDEISSSPKRFPSRGKIGEGYRICSHRSHDIYFSDSTEFVLIIRILNRRNIEVAIHSAINNI